MKGTIKQIRSLLDEYWADQSSSVAARAAHADEVLTRIQRVLDYGTEGALEWWVMVDHYGLARVHADSEEPAVLVYTNRKGIGDGTHSGRLWRYDSLADRRRFVLEVLRGKPSVRWL